MVRRSPGLCVLYQKWRGRGSAGSECSVSSRVTLSPSALRTTRLVYPGSLNPIAGCAQNHSHGESHPSTHSHPSPASPPALHTLLHKAKHRNIDTTVAVRLRRKRNLPPAATRRRLQLTLTVADWALDVALHRHPTAPSARRAIRT